MEHCSPCKSGKCPVVLSCYKMILAWFEDAQLHLPRPHLQNVLGSIIYGWKKLCYRVCYNFKSEIKGNFLESQHGILS